MKIVFIFLLISSIQLHGNAIMRYPNALNHETLQSLKHTKSNDKKIMTIFESNTYSLETIKTILQSFDPNLVIMAKKESNKIIILHDQNQTSILQKMLQKLNLKPIKIQLDCYIFEINEEYEKDLNLINSPLEKEFSINYNPISGIANTSSILETIKILEQKGHASLIAHPQFKIENGKKASLIIGEKLPYITTTTNTNHTKELLKHVQTGLDITIEAIILTKNQIQCSLSCDLTNVKLWKTIQNSSYPILATRKINIDTILTNNTPILITQFVDSISKTYESNMPILKKIPLINKITGVKTKKTIKTKLCILLKPTILKEKALD